MVELQWLLVGAGAQHVETAGLFESLGGEFLLRGQKVASRLPNLLLLEGVDACGGVSLRIVPDGLDFDKDEGGSVAGDDIKLSAVVGVVAGQNLKSVAH